MLFHDGLRKELAKFGATLPETPNRLATPAVPISRDDFELLSACNSFPVDQTGFDQVDLGNDRNWDILYLFGHGICLAHARIYRWVKPEIDGFWLPKRSENGGGYICRYFRIGCTHPRMSTRWSRMHERHDACPDCHFQANYDTSG